MPKLNNVLLIGMILASTVPIFADIHTKTVKYVTSGYGSTAGTMGQYILIKTTTGESYLFNGATPGYTAETIKAHLSVALMAYSTKMPVTFSTLTCIVGCGSSSTSIFPFKEITIGSYP